MLQDKSADLTENLVPDPTVTRQLTFGEKYVGLTFNPSGDLRVDSIKRLSAALIDEIQAHIEEARKYENPRMHEERDDIWKSSKILVLNAQMAAVKALTWKY